MPLPKFDRVELDRMLREGIPQKEIAKRLGVSSGAITQAKKHLNIAVVKNISLEAAHKVVNKHLDTLDQLQKINRHANEILDSLMKWSQGDAEALQVLESQIRHERGRGAEKEIRGWKKRDPRELALKAMAEIRNQLNLQVEIFKVLFDAEETANFQRYVLETIAEIDKSVRDKIIQKLKDNRSLRSAVRID